MAVFCSNGAFAATKINIAGQGELASFPYWLAKERGWDKEEGLDINLLYFDSGMAMLNALPSGEWHIGLAGAGLMGGLRYNTYIIGICNDDAPANGILVRADSPVMQHKGVNPAYPEAYGSAESIKGATILTSTVSTAHFAVGRWLQAFGLSDKDVVLKNMDQAQVLAAFENKIGDAIGVWSPFLQIGQGKGWKKAANGSQLGLGIGVWMMCDKAYGDKNPETVAKALRVYMRGVRMLREEPMETLLPVYKQFMTDWCGATLSDELMAQSIKDSPVLAYEEQLALFNADKGMSKAQDWLTEFAKFFVETKRITQADLDSIKGMPFATDAFLKKVQLPIPDYK